MCNDVFRKLDKKILDKIHWLYGNRFYINGTATEILQLINFGSITSYDRNTIKRMNYNKNNGNNNPFIFYFNKK